MWRSSVDSVGIRYESEATVADLEIKLAESWPGIWDVWVIETDGRIAAFLALEPAKSVIAQLFIAPDSQGQGLGTALIGHAKNRFPAGASLWTDSRNDRARGFYERNGFDLQRIEKHPVASHFRAYYAWQP